VLLSHRYELYYSKAAEHDAISGESAAICFSPCMDGASNQEEGCTNGNSTPSKTRARVGGDVTSSDGLWRKKLVLL
jgi:hypothetical protein